MSSVNKARSKPRLTHQRVLAISALLVAVTGAALPEDASQPVRGTYDNSLLLLDEGRQVFYGTAEKPAEIIQGTLKISGQQITIERTDGEIKKIIVTGMLAHYEQQPAPDQPIAMANAETITLDYDTQHMSAVGRVSFSQGGDRLTGCQVDYYLESRRLVTPTCADGSQAEFVITPREGQ